MGKVIHQSVDSDLKGYGKIKADYDSVVSQLAESTQQITDNGSSIKSNGAKTDGTNSLTAISTTITANSEVIIPNGSFTITNELPLASPVHLQGKKGNSITNTNTSANGDIRISSDNVHIEDLNFTGQSTVTGLYTSSPVKGLKISKSKLAMAKHGININTPNVEDVEIMNSNISSTSFAVLTNENAKNGKNLTVAFSKIYSSQSDAIELNNPSSTNTDTWKQAKIIGNSITADINGTGTSAGFAIGIANTRDVVVIGNTIDKSRNEALHIEDDQENIVVTGNVFNGCMTDGAKILKGGYSTQGAAKPVIVTNNHFIKNGITKTNFGIWRTYEVNGSLDSNFSNNYIRGFDVGLWMDGKASSNVGGCIIEDCNIAIKAGLQSVISGGILSMNCPTLVQGDSGSVIDKIVSKIKPTTVLQYVGTAGSTGATLKGFSIQNEVITGNAVSNTINLFPMASIMQGKLTVRNTGSQKLWFTCDILWDGTTLTVSNLMKKVGGIMGSTITVINNGGQLAFTIYTGSSVTTTLVYDFDGIYYQE